ncbi:MAG TPA: sigma-70 family RNA polymerase sigma factor [Candidatus Limnocylindrales bacterium]|nr:sigma-70 family RNA polymerase sigma factor [Candidatus Limnocylindrales bacterium]
MTDDDWLAERFETHRRRLRAVAYRMLGSLGEADDAVQDAWLRLSRADSGGIDDLGAWLTTVVARICLDMLRSRRARREDAIGVHLPEPLIAADLTSDPEQGALLADSVGLALLVVLDTLTPAERLAFVLHDTFGLRFEEIAPIVDRTPVAARQLASRARRRVRGAAIEPDVDLARQRVVVDAFVAAARDGNFAALLAVLDPDVVVRAGAGAVGAGAVTSRTIRGKRVVAETALGFRRFAGGGRHVVVNGAAGLAVFAGDRPFAVLAFTVRRDRIAAIDILADPARVAALGLEHLLEAPPAG